MVRCVGATHVRSASRRPRTPSWRLGPRGFAVAPRSTPAPSPARIASTRSAGIAWRASADTRASARATSVDGRGQSSNRLTARTGTRKGRKREKVPASPPAVDRDPPIDACPSGSPRSRVRVEGRRVESKVWFDPNDVIWELSGDVGPASSTRDRPSVGGSRRRPSRATCRVRARPTRPRGRRSPGSRR